MTSRHFRFLSSDEKGDWPGDLGARPPSIVRRAGDLLVNADIAMRAARRGLFHAPVRDQETDATHGLTAIGAPEFRTSSRSRRQPTAAITTARTNLMTKTLGPELTKAPAARRKAIVPVTARLQRRIRYWRIVTTGNPYLHCALRSTRRGGHRRRPRRHPLGGRSTGWMLRRSVAPRSQLDATPYAACYRPIDMATKWG